MILRRLRPLAFNIVMVGAGLVLCLAGRPLVWLAPHRLTGVAKLWARICLPALRLCCGTGLRVRGLEHLPAGAAIIAAQHQSELDIFIWLNLCPKPAFVLKQELCKIPIFGPLLAPAGMIPVDRGGGAPALRKMVADCRKALAEGRQVIIFPEGTRVAPGARAPLQPGIAALAKTVSVPLLPAATNSGRFWGRRALDKTAGTACLDIHPALPARLPREALFSALAAVFYGADLSESPSKPSGITRPRRPRAGGD